MTSRRFYIILILMIGIGLGVFYFIRAGFYPVAFVNSSFLSARTLHESVEAAHRHNKTRNLYSEEQLKQERAILIELRRGALDKLIENKLVANELLVRDKGGELARSVEKKLDIPRIKTPDFAESVSTLYGLTLERFTELVLEPQAKQEILFDKIKDGKGDFGDWLKTARLGAKVIILAPDLKWDGEKVVLK